MSAAASRDVAAALAGEVFVLVPGAYHGGWCWDMVAARLRAGGADVYATTPPGMAERRAELTANVGLEAFVDDVADTLERHDLLDVVLVGHSFGGIAITVVADRLAHRIKALVYLDSLILFDGQRAYDVIDQAQRHAIDRIVAATAPGQVATLPVPIGHDFGVQDSAALEWMRPQLSPHPLRTYLDRLTLRREFGAGVPGVYFDCQQPPSLKLSAVKSRTLPLLPWPIHPLATGHDAMISDPALVADVLAQVARGEFVDALDSPRITSRTPFYMATPEAT